jgi:uncharacterized protein
VEEVVKMIVDHPEEVAVEEADGERGGASLNLRVAQTDVGKVIGKQGRTIRSLRNLVSAASTKQNRYYSLEIIEEEGEGNRGPRSRSRMAAVSHNDDDGEINGNTEDR